MKKNSSGIVWGILLILGGIAIGGKVLDWFDFDLFFSGWWTLFIIIPSAVRFFTERGRRISALKGMCLGLLLLMAAQGFIEYRMFIPLLAAAFLMLTGLRMILPGEKKNKQEAERAGEKNFRHTPESDYVDAAQYSYEDEYDYNGGFYEEPPRTEAGPDRRRQGQDFAAENEGNAGTEYHYTASYNPEYDENRKKRETEWNRSREFEWNQYSDRRQYRRRTEGGPGSQFREGFWDGFYGTRKTGHCVCTSIFSGKEISYSHEVFDGAMLSCVMGGIDLDLTDAVLYQDTVIEAKVFFGGIDIIVPKNVRVVVKGTPVFGGIDNHVKRKAPLPPDAVTINVNAVCVMGGIEIKTKGK